MSGLYIGDITQPLIGQGIAGGIQTHGLVIGIGRAFQQIHGLQYMRMTAHDHIHAQIAGRLGHFLLLAVLLGLILLAPVDIQHDGLGAVGPHIRNILLQILLKALHIVLQEHIDQALFIFLQIRAAVEIHLVRVGIGLVGVVDHANADAVNFLNEIAVSLCIWLGADMIHAVFGNDLLGTEKAQGLGIIGMVIGSQQHIKAGSLQTADDTVGTIEIGIATIAVAAVQARQSGLQIGHRIVRPPHIVLHVGKIRGKIIAAVRLFAGIDTRFVHQDITGGGNGGRTDLHHRRLGGLGGGRLRGRGAGLGGGGQRGIHRRLQCTAGKIQRKRHHAQHC